MSSHPASLSRYPGEQGFLRYGAGASFGLHFLIAGSVVLLAFFTHIKSIQQLMAEGGSIAQSGPAPEETIEVLLRPDDLPPPPPTPTPEFVRQVEEPKPVVIPPPEITPPKPKPVTVAKPRFTAPKATGTGESATVSKLVIGSSGFPRPGYPYQAQLRHQTGTVTVSIQFDATGSAADVEVVGTSGVPLLDSTTRSFIREHWRNEGFAGRSVSVPIEYRLN